MIVLLAAGVGVFVVGLLAIGFGIPISDSSFGNALLIAGVVILCTGLILLGMWLVARELAKLGKLIVAQDAYPGRPVASENLFVSSIGDPRGERLRDDGADHVRVSGSLPWAEEAARSRPRSSGSEIPPIEPVAAPPPPAPDRPARRNLMFSTKRRDRLERLAQQSSAQPPPTAHEAEPRTSFENTWSKPARQNDLAERVEPSAPPAEETTGDDRDVGASAAPRSERAAAEPATPASSDLPPGVTVVRSGTVDEMTYTYYSDGSIEAQLPGEGPIRFASLDELRTYVEQRK